LKESDKRILLYFEFLLITLYVLVDLGFIFFVNGISGKLANIGEALTLWPLYIADTSHLVIWISYFVFNAVVILISLIGAFKLDRKYLITSALLLVLIITNIVFFGSMLSALARV